MGLPATASMSPEDFLSWEATQQEKHEYYQGEVFEVFAMVGATRKHVTVSVNLCNLLSAHLEGSPCRVYMADMKLRVDAANAYFYPDVFVTCDAADHRAEMFMASPTLVIEVLSPATEAHDRGAKFAAYRLLPSLKEYLLVDPELRRIESFLRNEQGSWVLREFSAQAPVRLESVGLETSFDEVFRRVD